MTDVGPIGDRYELRRLIGQGSMGQVWQANDKQLKRPVAVKVINPERLTGPVDGLTAEDMAARFRREAELGARFSHPNIPVLFDAHVLGSPKDLFMVWELVLGKDLEKIIKGGRLPIARALSIARQIADVLQCIHADPVIHRDLKPANIMLTDTWRVKVLDFGVAAVFGTANPRLTQVGQLLGTVNYMAPEQFGGTIDPKVDLYALGCVLYEMLTGEPPFTGAYAVVMDEHRKRPPTPVQILRPDIPEGVAALVMALLAKETGGRPASARSVYEQLTSYYAAMEVRSDPHERKLSDFLDDGSSAKKLPIRTRMGAALALFDDGHFGRALPIYKELSDELATTEGEAVYDAFTCRAQAAYCDMRLGNKEQALFAYESLVQDLSYGEDSEELRLQCSAYIGLLQESMGRAEEALNTLATLYPLLSARLGKEASHTSDVRAALNRLRSVSYL
ncbi:protein kinase [Streptomyces sp. NPDC056296]|uniref:serine/threonine-protein kinase n=1 Tax=Streptomyces sp. NPDC056296 TaxID=3345775 RepID=UPI0035E340B2